MGKYKRIIIIIIFLLIAAIVLIVSAIDKSKQKNNNTINEYNYVVNNSNKIAPMNEVVTTTEDENTVKQTYLDDIRNGEVINDEKMDDYQINELRILSDEEKSKIIKLYDGEVYKDTDTLAYITYSVKPNDLDSSLLKVGTGVQNGDWITFEHVCVCIRDKKIISAGTSW